MIMLTAVQRDFSDAALALEEDTDMAEDMGMAEDLDSVEGMDLDGVTMMIPITDGLLTIRLFLKMI